MQPAAAADYKSLYEQSQLRILALEQQLQQLQKMIFGSMHERFIPSSASDPQLSLDIKADATTSVRVTSTKKISCRK
jgi:transposase